MAKGLGLTEQGSDKASLVALVALSDIANPMVETWDTLDLVAGR